MREVYTKHLCELPADVFWQLRMDLGFDRFIAELEAQDLSVVEVEEEEDQMGNQFIARTTKLTHRENPVPPALRGIIAGNDFSFTVRAKWFKYIFDEEHAMTMTTELPFFSDRIKIGGKQWAEPGPSPMQCYLCSRVELRASIVGLGGQIEKLIEKGMRDAYQVLPSQAERYHAQKLSTLQSVPPVLEDAAVASACQGDATQAPQQVRHALNGEVAMDAGRDFANAPAAQAPPLPSPLVQRRTSTRAVSAQPIAALRSKARALAESLCQIEDELVAQEQLQANQLEEQELERQRELQQLRKLLQQTQQELADEKQRSAALVIALREEKARTATVLSASQQQSAIPSPLVEKRSFGHHRGDSKSSLGSDGGQALAEQLRSAFGMGPVPTAGSTASVLDAQTAAVAASEQDPLLLVADGAYAGEPQCGHVGLGARSLLCTEKRLLCVSTGMWELEWQVPWAHVRGLELLPTRCAVLLHVYDEKARRWEPTRTIFCVHPGGMQLAYSTIKQAYDHTGHTMTRR